MGRNKSDVAQMVNIQGHGEPTCTSKPVVRIIVLGYTSERSRRGPEVKTDG